MIKRLGFILCVIGCPLFAPLTAGAQPPSPVNGVLFAFPVSSPVPSSGRSAGLALSDLWLGHDPTRNPAAGVPRSITLSPALVRTSRQDLRADNRRVDEQTAFLDAGAVWLGLPVGDWAFSLYAFQPFLRREENAFLRGDVGGPTPPAAVQSQSTMREIKAGLAASMGVGVVRIGVAGELARRDDEFTTIETSGAPDAGTRRVDYSGNGVGFQIGVRADLDPSRPGAIVIGAGARHTPAITMEGEQRMTLVLGDSVAPVSVEREAGWDGGVSARAAFGKGLGVLAGLGYQTAQEWRGFDVRSGAGSLWSLGIEYHDERDPWTFRFGLGGSQQEDVPESRSTIIGLGLGWRLGTAMLDFGLSRRGLTRADSPTSFDDRLVASLHMPL
jgi:hypothetical protein